MYSEKIGNWFLGSKGFLRTKLVAHFLYERIKKNAERQLGESFPRYLPWMSLKEELEKLRPILNLEPHQIETRPEVLKTIADAISRPGDALYALHLDVVVPGQEIEQGESENALLDWKEKASAGLELYFRASELFKKRFDFFIQTLIPLKVNPSREFSLTNANFVPSRTAISSHSSLGAIYRATPDPREDEFWRVTFAIDVAHEVAHHVLAFYQRSDRIISSSFDTQVYSSIMKKERPCILSFHAVAALVYMIEFVDALLLRPELISGEEKDFLLDERKDYLRSLDDGLKSTKYLEFTELGQLLKIEFQSLLEAA